jgi:hypothetical protein
MRKAFLQLSAGKHDIALYMAFLVASLGLSVLIGALHLLPGISLLS